MGPKKKNAAYHVAKKPHHVNPAVLMTFSFGGLFAGCFKVLTLETPSENV